MMGNRGARAVMLQQAEDAEWERVRNEPRLAINDVHARGVGLRRLQLIVVPSREPPSAWEVRQIQDWQLIRPRIVETRPHVVLVGHEVIPFESVVLASYFERIIEITVSLRPDLSGNGGLDGTTYELALFGDLNSAWRFQWWTTSPECWRPLAELAAEMQSAFTAALAPDIGSDPGGT